MSVEIGRQAETLAAEYLMEHNFVIVERNWRNRWCELDLVARKDDRIHFVEVKYRRYNAFGTPIDNITYDKANRLRRAANAWCMYHHYNGSYQIDVISLEGDLDHPTISYLADAIN